MAASEPKPGPLRVGIVGAGIRGRMYATIASRLHNAETVGICDTNADARRSAGESLGIPAFAGTAEMCKSASPDAVIVATPDFAHLQPCLEAVEAGADLLIEKPLATSVSDARTIAEAVADSAVRAMLAFENHWNPPLTAMKAAADAGEVGRFVSCNSQLDDRIDVPTEMNAWLGQSTVGWFLMSHTIELAGWIAGQKPVGVFASGGKNVLKSRGIDTYDFIHAVIEFDGGMVGSFSSCWVLPKSIPLIFQFRHEMVGEAGSLRADFTDQMLHKATVAYEHPATIGVSMTGAPVSPPAQMLSHFVTEVLAGGPLPCGLDQGVLNVAAISAIHQSAESGKFVQLSSLLGK